MKQIKDILRADILYAIFFFFFCKTEIDDFNMLRNITIPFFMYFKYMLFPNKKDLFLRVLHRQMLNKKPFFLVYVFLN